MVLKHRQFKNSESDKIESRYSKHQQLDVHNNQERKSLDKLEFENKGENITYISFLFDANPPPQKELSCLTEINKESKSLNHLICILKIS